MNSETVKFVDMLYHSSVTEDIQRRAKNLVGRNDAVERLAEYIQDLCPCIQGVEMSASDCVLYEQQCGINFRHIAHTILLKLDPIRLV